MKKLLEKIVSIALTVVGLLFVALLLVLMFGAVDAESLDNQIVKALIAALSALFLVLAIIDICAAFKDNERLNAILLFKNKESATNATAGVVKKLARKAAKQIPDAKVNKVTIVSDENGDVHLKLAIKVKADDAELTVNRVRAVIADAFDKIMGVEFATIDFKVAKLKSAYKSKDSDIDAKVQEYLAAKTEATNGNAQNEGTLQTSIDEAQPTTVSEEDAEEVPPQANQLEADITTETDDDTLAVSEVEELVPTDSDSEGTENN